MEAASRTRRRQSRRRRRLPARASPRRPGPVPASWRVAPPLDIRRSPRPERSFPPAPASMDMLQTVMRPSIDSERIAEPRYSTTWPTAGRAEPADNREHMSFALTPSGGRLDGDGHGAGPALGRVWWRERAQLPRSRCRTPAPQRHMGRCVAVSADDRHAGWVRLARPDHVHYPLFSFPMGNTSRRTQSNSRRAPRAVSARPVLHAAARSRGGTLWSAVAIVRSGRLTRRPASRTLRRPAAMSPRGRGAGRCRADRSAAPSPG